MKTKFILLTITFTLCSVAQAVEYGQYQPIYQTSSTLGGYGSNYNASGYGSYGTSYSGYRSTSAISAPGAMYAPSVSSPFSGNTYGNSVFMTADENLAIALQPTPYESRSARRIGMRRVAGDKPTRDGSYYGEIDDGWMWDEGEGDWVKIPEGTILGDKKWNGSEWVPIDHQADPDQPVGSIPWLLMVLLVGAYAYRHKKEVI